MKVSREVEKSSNFISLAETLSGAGWRIVEFKDGGYGITLTIIPQREKGASEENHDF